MSTAHPTTITLAAGTYTVDGLVGATQAALDAAGVGVESTLDNTGALRLSTRREGSNATIQITGGNARDDLGLASNTAAHAGTDGIIDIGGDIITVSNVEAGSTITSGSLTVGLAGGLRIGDATVRTVSTGSGTLADVAAAINSANAGVGASAVKVADGSWRLQMTSRTTGANGAIAIDGSVLAGIGGLRESAEAQNAQITIGSGAGAFAVENSTNTFSDVLQGVKLNVTAVSTEPVTVDVARDDEALATDVEALVSAANSLLGDDHHPDQGRRGEHDARTADEQPRTQSPSGRSALAHRCRRRSHRLGLGRRHRRPLGRP
jgi:flagellar hook-associated protein 2